VFPIIGGRKVEQLHENIAALDISLTAEQIERIEKAAPFEPGFPNKLIVSVSLQVCLSWYLITSSRVTARLRTRC